MPYLGAQQPFCRGQHVEPHDAVHNMGGEIQWVKYHATHFGI